MLRYPPASAAQTLDTDVLRSFVAIVEAGTFRAAAARVHRTPSALSMQIKTLENTLGQALFVRGPRRAQLTDHGEILLSYARRLLALNAEAVGQFLAPAVQGQVTLGLPDDLGRDVLPVALGELAYRFPQIRVHVVTDISRRLVARFDADELDVMLVTADNSGIDTSGMTLIHTEAMGWALRRDGLAATRRPLPVALADAGCAWRDAALAALDRQDLAYRIVCSSQSAQGQAAAAAADLAVAALPLRLIEAPLVTATGLPALAATHVGLRVAADRGEAVDVLADCLGAAFQRL